VNAIPARYSLTAMNIIGRFSSVILTSLAIVVK